MDMNRTPCIERVVKWAEENGVAWRPTKTTGLTISGILVDLRGKFQVSVQTDARTAGYAVAETALVYEKQLVYAMDYGIDVIRWRKKSELIAHLADLLERLEGYCVVTSKGKMRLHIRNGKKSWPLGHDSYLCSKQ